MIYKMKLTDSSDSMTFDLLEVPIVDKDIEGAVDNVTLDGNQYTDYLWLKKQYMQKWAILCDTEYTQLRGFYTRQFENATIPTYRLYYGTNNFLDKAVSGEYITTNVSGIEQAPIADISLLGNTTQNGTPTPDAPVPISTVTGEQTVQITGKNLLIYPYKHGTSAVDGVTFTDNGDGSITVNGTSTASTQSIWYFYENAWNYNSLSFELEAGTYTFKGLGVNNVGMACNFYFSDNTNEYLYIGQNDVTKTIAQKARLNIRLVVNRGVTVNNVTIYPQIELGSTATTYEPYQGQEYEINLGKNLLPATNGSETINDVVFTKNSDGSITANGTASASINYYTNGLTYTEVQAGTYTLSDGVGSGESNDTFFTFLDGAPNFNSTLNNPTFTLSQATNLRARIVVRSGVTLNNVVFKVQLEKGSTTSSYAPYITPIELCKIGTYQDYIWNDNGTWRIHKAVGKVTFDGSETWVMSSSGGLTRFASPTITGASSVASRSVIISDYFHYVASGNEIGAGFIYATQFFAYPTADIMTASDFKTWLGTHNTTVYYILTTPTDTEITDETLIAQLDALETAKLFLGVNNITTETENEQPTMNIKYTEIYDRETDVISTTAVRLTLTDDGVINNCGCRQNVQLTMRETVS